MAMRTALAAAALLATPTVAGAQGPYVEFAVGGGLAGEVDIDGAGAASDYKLDIEPGYLVSVGGGYDFGTNFRIEAEALYLDNEVDTKGLLRSVDTSTLGGFANAVYAPDIGSRLRPYVGGGIGYAQQEVEVTPLVGAKASTDDGGFAWQLKAGAEFDVTPNVALTGGYRYLSVSVEENSTEVDSTVHSASVGVKFKTGGDY